MDQVSFMFLTNLDLNFILLAFIIKLKALSVLRLPDFSLFLFNKNKGIKK